jgi:hypothetical protein
VIFSLRLGFLPGLETSGQTLAIASWTTPLEFANIVRRKLHDKNIAKLIYTVDWINASPPIRPPYFSSSAGDH